MRLPRCHVLEDILLVRCLGTAASHPGEFHRFRANERPEQAKPLAGAGCAPCAAGPIMDLPTTLRGAVKIQLHVRADGAGSSFGFDAPGARASPQTCGGNDRYDSDRGNGGQPPPPDDTEDAL